MARHVPAPAFGTVHRRLSRSRRGRVGPVACCWCLPYLAVRRFAEARHGARRSGGSSAVELPTSKSPNHALTAVRRTVPWSAGMRARRPSADGDASASPTVIAPPAAWVRHWRLARRKPGSHLTQRSVPRVSSWGTVSLPTRRRHPHARRWPQAHNAHACGRGEDRHASGPNQESDDDKDDPQQHLPLEKLDDSGDHEDHRDYPQDGCHGLLLPGGRRPDTRRGTICRRRKSHRHGAGTPERRTRRLRPFPTGASWRKPTAKTPASEASVPVGFRMLVASEPRITAVAPRRLPELWAEGRRETAGPVGTKAIGWAVDSWLPECEARDGPPGPPHRGTVACRAYPNSQPARHNSGSIDRGQVTRREAVP
jgi:hypothetical protein